MAKMSSSTESSLLLIVKVTAAILQALPYRLSMGLARLMGRLSYYVLPKKRAVIYANLRTVFAGQKSPSQLKALTKTVMMNLVQSVVEFFCLPVLKRKGFEQVVGVEGRDNLQAAINAGKGVVLLAIHQGNWELASVVGSVLGYPYNMVANEQAKTPQLDILLNEYRALMGARVIAPGVATREIIRALKNNEIVTLVFDQGGQEGKPVSMFGKTASMSTGALRLGLKYGAAVCPVWIKRNKDGGHVLSFMPKLDLSDCSDDEQGLTKAMTKAAAFFETKLLEYPDEYMWFYKFFKYSTQGKLLVLDDGKTGHLRQSQATAQLLEQALELKGKEVSSTTVTVAFKTRRRLKLFQLYAGLAQYLSCLRNEEALGWFLSPESYEALQLIKPDWIISTASSMGTLNYFLKACYAARSICILKSGLVSRSRFDLVIMPEHDEVPSAHKMRLVQTKAALNLITTAYLNEQQVLLLKQYSHLKSSVRTKIGVLLGGDTKQVVFSEAQVKVLLRQVKEASLHFNAEILLTTSRRTSKEIDAVVQRELKGFERLGLCVIANQENPPYALGGILGLADIVIVSGESVSMVSEAVASGKPVIVFSPDGDYQKEHIKTKYDRFVYGLNEGGFVLACAIKDIAFTLQNVMRKKTLLKKLDDRQKVLSAIKELL